MKTLSYFVFGPKKEYQLELSFSVLSAVRFLRERPADIRIVLITEEGRTRPDLPIEHVHFSKEEFAEWSGPHGNVHRAKEFALFKVLETYGGCVAHIDPDTYFLKHPDHLFERISQSDSLMHEYEGTLASQQIWEPILSTGITECNGYPITTEAPMYNSGIIGIHHDNRHWLLEAKKIEDELHAIAPVFNIEQFATGVVLDKHSRLHDCKDVVKHYWGSERGFIHAQCADLFPEFTRDVFEKLVAARDLPKVGFPTRSLRSRLAARIKLRSRSLDSNYRFAYLAACEAERLARACRRDANLWASIAVERLNHAYRFVRSGSIAPDKTSLWRDFGRFSDDQLRSNDWMESRVKEDWVGFWRSIERRQNSRSNKRMT